MDVFIYLSCIPRSGIDGSYNNSTSNFFKELPEYFPKCLHHFTSPQAAYEGSNFYIFLPALMSFWLSPYWLVQSGISWFWFLFPWLLMILSIFSFVLMAISMSSLNDIEWYILSIQVLCPVFCWVIYLFNIQLEEFLIRIILQIHDLQVFSPSTFVL